MNNPSNEASASQKPSSQPEAVTTQAAFVEKAERDLREWNGQLDRLTNQAEKLASEAKATALKQVGELKMKLGAARDRLNASKSVAGDKWNEARTGLETLWSEVRSMFEKHSTKTPS